MKNNKMLRFCIDYKFKFKEKVTLVLIFKPKLTRRRYYTRAFISSLIERVERIELKGDYNYEDLIFIKQFKKDIIYK